MNRIGPKKKCVRFIDSLLSVRLFCATRAKIMEKKKKKNSTWNWNLRSRQQAAEKVINSHLKNRNESRVAVFGNLETLISFKVSVCLHKRTLEYFKHACINEANLNFQRLWHIFPFYKLRLLIWSWHWKYN